MSGKRPKPTDVVAWKVLAHGAHVKVERPESVSAKQVEDLLAKYRPSTPLPRVERALAAVGARFVAWDDGSPGDGGVWDASARDLEHQAHLRFQDRMAALSKKQPAKPIYPAVALEAGANAELDIVELKKSNTQQRRRAQRAEAAGAGAAAVGLVAFLVTAAALVGRLKTAPSKETAS